MNNYIPFAQIQCKHEYYYDGILKNFKIVPTKDTVELMIRLGVLLKEERTGITLFRSDKTIGLIDEESKEIELSFLLELTDPLFHNFTDLPASDFHRQILRFNNEDRPSLSEDNVCLLHQAKYTSEEDLVDKDESMQLSPSVMGTIDLKQKLVEGAEMQKYEIRFNSRAVFWRYYIVESVNAPDLYEITSNNNDGVFLKPVLKTLPNSSSAYEVISSEPIRFKERYEDVFDLKSEKTGTVVIASLPYGTPSTLTQNQDSDYYVDIYVYL